MYCFFHQRKRNNPLSLAMFYIPRGKEKLKEQTVSESALHPHWFQIKAFPHVSTDDCLGLYLHANYS